MNYYFTIVFLYEMIVKLIGHGFLKYSVDPMNILDAFIAITSLLNLIFNISTL